MDESKYVSSRDISNKKKRIKKMIRIKRKELIQLERLLRDTTQESKQAKTKEDNRKRIRDQITNRKFTKRELLKLLKELNDDEFHNG